MHHLHPFFKYFLGETPTPPPLLREDKKFPSLAFPLQLRWKFSRITYTEDRGFESKNFTQFLGKKSTRTRQKWATNAPFASFFQKFSRGDLDPPLLREDKNVPSLAFLQQLRWKFSPHHVHKRSEIWKKKLHTIFGEKIDTNSAKIG